VLNCAGHSPLPKYVFVLSLENRSFDHLFGRSKIAGKDAEDRSKPRSVNGVLTTGGTIDPQYSNKYTDEKGTTTDVNIPANKAPFRMPGDPKHEFEHILCQTCGPKACVDLYTAFNAAPDGMTPNLDKFPVPQQSMPTRSASFSRPAPDNSGFVHSWVKSYTRNSIEKGANTPAVAAVPDHLDEAMRCFDTQTQLPVLYDLATKFVLCDNFFSSLPGPTGPNRFFMMAGSSGGYDASPSDMLSMETTGHLDLKKGHIFQTLKDNKIKAHVFGDDTFPMAAVLKGMSLPFVDRLRGSDPTTFQSYVSHASADHPFPFNFVWLEPDYDVASSLIPPRHAMYSTGNSMHPCSDVRKAEQLISDVYSAIRGNESIWQQCVLIITWDEHGGFYDHVPSPTATPPNDGAGLDHNQWGFNFDRFGTRVPTLIISPLIEAGLVDHRQYDHGSILATVIALYNKGAFTNCAIPTPAMQPMTDRVAQAKDFLELFTLATPRTDAPRSLAAPIPLSAPDPDGPSVQDLQPGAEDPKAPPSGNTELILVAALNLHKSIDPTLNVQATAASIKTNQDAGQYLARAKAAIDAARQQPLANA
jgi:phospholipase C